MSDGMLEARLSALELWMRQVREEGRVGAGQLIVNEPSQPNDTPPGPELRFGADGGPRLRPMGDTLAYSSDGTDDRESMFLRADGAVWVEGVMTFVASPVFLSQPADSWRYERQGFLYSDAQGDVLVLARITDEQASGVDAAGVWWEFDFDAIGDYEVAAAGIHLVRDVDFERRGPRVQALGNFGFAAPVVASYWRDAANPGYRWTADRFGARRWAVQRPRPRRSVWAGQARARWR